MPAERIAATLKVESNFNPGAISHVGAIGIAQFMPATAKSFGFNPKDPKASIRGAAKYLSQSFRLFGRWDYAHACYNAGCGAVHKYSGIPPYPETQDYVVKIEKAYKQYVELS